jgi:hypothetical protein
MQGPSPGKLEFTFLDYAGASQAKYVFAALDKSLLAAVECK